MKRKACGKINLSIDVVRRRLDGYHELDMIVLPIDLYDELEINIAEKGSYVSNVDLPYDGNNIIYRSIELLRKEFGFTEQFSIKLNKNIPMGAGLAGGSTNGAAAMIMVNKLLKLGLSRRQLAEYGKRIGADIPFCIYGKPARVRGIGEDVKPIKLNRHYHLVLIKPHQGICTAEAFEKLDIESAQHPDIDALQKAITNGEPFAHLLGNSLQQSAFRLLPQIEEIIKTCKDLGAENVLMSGSGSACFVIDEKAEVVDRVYEFMKERYDFVYKTAVLDGNM